MASYLKRLLRALDWQEAVLTFLVAIIAAVAFYKLYALHDQSLITGGDDVWFQSDMSRVFENMTNQHSDGHFRVKVHPLYSLLTYPPTFVIERLGAGPFKAVQIVTASMASLWMLALYALLRLVGCVRFDALLFSVLGACSASAIFWLSVPESYALGSISIAAGLALASLANQKKLPEWTYVAVSSLTLSATITNWMVGILSTLFGNSWRRTFLITLISLSLVTILWGLEKHIFPTAVFFMGDREEANYMFRPNIDRVVSVVRAFVFHTMMSPVFSVTGDNGHGWPILSTQASLPGSAGLLSVVGTIVWIALLGLGAWTLVTLKKHLALRGVLGLSIIGQLALHVLYGEETFLYSLHFLPLLITLAALSTLTRLRVSAIILVIVLIPIGAANNWAQFKEANTIAISPRHEVKNQMELRPQDPWPRSQGHVVLALPGSEEKGKAYHEPGGSFSPGAGTFGISVWLTNPRGELIVSSDTIPVDEISQSFRWSDEQQLPHLKTTTEHYSTEWKSIGWGSWQLELHVPDKTALNPSLLIRSVGPAGGAIRELSLDGEVLLINKRWSLTLRPAPKGIYLGEEGFPGWKGIKGGPANIASQSGWAFARIELGEGKQWIVNIQDEHPSSAPEFREALRATDLYVDLPDEHFQQSLNAQIAHLMMGLVGRETRPGDPINYPLAWQRDGAYVLVALARAGKLEIAKMLSMDIAERDFFGGFGPEADAPGLGIWALVTVANQLHQEDFDKWLWPHVYRKAAIIEEMLNARSKIHKNIEGPIVPKYTNDPELTLLAEPAREGLIVGRMDQHRPVLFINALSYRGLLAAASLASRLHHFKPARRWAATAEKIKGAWEEAFTSPLSNNDRTYINPLWPSWVASEKRQSLQDNLDGRWTDRHDAKEMYNKNPLWTYFELAETHQWLFLGRHDRVWSTLKWFWNHQSSHGLYTWWEGQGEENSFGKWENVRGWVNPPNVTPHYWTAAEMALLQLDMLGYIDEGGNEPTLVIGGGIPTHWLSEDMNVRGLRIGTFVLDWHWNGKMMKAVIRGDKQIKAKLGTGFPDNADLELTYQN